LWGARRAPSSTVARPFWGGTLRCVNVDTYGFGTTHVAVGAAHAAPSTAYAGGWSVRRERSSAAPITTSSSPYPTTSIPCGCSTRLGSAKSSSRPHAVRCSRLPPTRGTSEAFPAPSSLYTRGVSSSLSIHMCTASSPLAGSTTRVTGATAEGSISSPPSLSRDSSGQSS